eukprot:2920873-Amphidinium_carterae.1
MSLKPSPTRESNAEILPEATLSLLRAKRSSCQCSTVLRIPTDCLTKSKVLLDKRLVWWFHLCTVALSVTSISSTISSWHSA